MKHKHKFLHFLYTAIYSIIAFKKNKAIEPTLAEQKNSQVFA